MISGNASYGLPNYASKHQVRGGCKCGGISIHISLYRNCSDKILCRPHNGEVWNSFK